MTRHPAVLLAAALSTTFAATPTLAQSIDLPFSDDFDSGSIDGNRWGAFVRAVVNTNALAEPSPDFALNFFGAGQITSDPIAANVLGTLGEVVTVSFWVQHRGVENAERLMLEYTDDQGDWNTLIEVVSDGVDQDTFAFEQVALPIDGYHPNLRIRFISTSNQTNDTWWIDSVRVGPFAGTNPPFIDDFENGFDDLTDWAVVFNADTPQDADPNPPSGNRVARLNSNDVLETVNQLLGVEPNRSLQQYVRFWARADGPEPGESLRVEYLDNDANNDGIPGDTTYRLLTEVVAEGFGDTCFRLVEVPIPMEDHSDEFRVRFTSLADEFNDFWFIDDFSISDVTVPLDPDCVLVDLAANCGVLDLADVDVFITSFISGGTFADLAFPFGILDLADVDTFINTFDGTCTQPYGEPEGNLAP